MCASQPNECFLTECRCRTENTIILLSCYLQVHFAMSFEPLTIALAAQSEELRSKLVATEKIMKLREDIMLQVLQHHEADLNRTTRFLSALRHVIEEAYPDAVSLIPAINNFSNGLHYESEDTEEEAIEHLNLDIGTLYSDIEE